jgi:hypothetical protein
MRFALLLAALAFLASCGNQSRLIDGHLQAYRYVVVERAEVAQASDRGDFAAELAAELARSGFEVVDAARLDRDAAVADEAVQAYARVDDGTLWTSVAVTLKDYRTGAPVWEHGDKSNTRAKANRAVPRAPAAPVRRVLAARGGPQAAARGDRRRRQPAVEGEPC